MRNTERFVFGLYPCAQPGRRSRLRTECDGDRALEFAAYVSPTAAKPEPVRDFTFYVLTKSYEDIKHEIVEANGAPDREKLLLD